MVGLPGRDFSTYWATSLPPRSLPPAVQVAGAVDRRHHRPIRTGQPDRLAKTVDGLGVRAGSDHDLVGVHGVIDRSLDGTVRVKFRPVAGTGAVGSINVDGCGLGSGHRRQHRTGSNHHGRCRVPHVVLTKTAPVPPASGGRRTDSTRGKSLVCRQDGAHSDPRPALSHRGGAAPSPLSDRHLPPVPQQDQQVEDADRAVAIEVCRAGTAV